MTEQLFAVLLKLAREWRTRSDGTAELRSTLDRDEQNAIGQAMVLHIFGPDRARATNPAPNATPSPEHTP